LKISSKKNDLIEWSLGIGARDMDHGNDNEDENEDVSW
jgi:hypothetical protein